MEQSPIAPPELVLLHDTSGAFSILLQGGFEMLVPHPYTDVDTPPNMRFAEMHATFASNSTVYAP